MSVKVEEMLKKVDALLGKEKELIVLKGMLFSPAMAHTQAHMLRNTFATKYLMNGGYIFSLQQILGHTSLDMVRKYSHIASSYVIHTHKKFSPLDNIHKAQYN